MRLIAQRGKCLARILVIDDDDVLRTAIRIMLETAGHEVLENAGTDSNWSVSELAGRLDLVITDMLMPGKDGIQVIQELKETADAPPVLVISGGGMEGSQIYLAVARALGAAGTLAKPFTREELLRKVAVLLRRSSIHLIAAPKE